jgi:cell division protein FtsL
MVDFNDVYGSAKSQGVKIVREVDRVSIRNFRLYLVVGFLFASLLVVYGWERQKVIHYGYEIEALKKESDSLDDAYRKLNLERASLRSLQRIDEYARVNLGLIPPPSRQIIFRPVLDTPNNLQSDLLLAFNQKAQKRTDW